MQEAFIRAIDNGQLSHAYLFEGAKGIGKGIQKGEYQSIEKGAVKTNFYSSFFVSGKKPLIFNHFINLCLKS